MSKRFRFLVLLFIVVLCGASLFPTIQWYFFVSDDVKQRVASSREAIRDYALQTAQKDVDSLQQLLQKDDEVIITSAMESAPYNTPGIANVVDVAAERAKNARKPIPKKPSAKRVFMQYDSKTDVFDTIVDFYRGAVIKLKEQKNRIINLGLDLSGGISVTLQVDKADLAERLGKQPSADDMANAINRAIIVLQSRIDKFGVSEPKIRRQNEDSILIEAPGDNDKERINSFIQGKGSMSFRIVNGDVTRQLINLQTTNPSWVYNPNEPLDVVPVGTEVMEYVTRDGFGLDKHQRWIAVYSDVDTYGIDGAFLEQAQVTRDTLTNRPLVNFQLNAEGAQRLSKLTGDYLNESMAIVLDNKVRAYATLTSVINNGQAVIQGFSQEVAQDIATILQTAVLPVKLNVINQQVIGPTLGQAVIQAGLRASGMGLLLVVVFMILYYRGPGVISVLSLIFNLLFLFAVLASFNFTVTLTGIAGIILTIGMAVDANVLIYERIKEELWAGKTRRTAIQNGFKKAFLTIVDANVTTFIAAFFVSQIASGPVQGFAVTLSAGIITTLVSSLFVSRLFFDIATDSFGKRAIRISWRKMR